MTVSAQSVEHSYRPAAAHAAEALAGIVFTDQSELKVTWYEADTGKAHARSEGVHYTISGDGLAAAGSIVALGTYPAADRWTIERVTPRLQQSEFPARQPVVGPRVEQALDRTMRVDQEQDAKILNLDTRTIKAPWNEAGFSIPSAGYRADKIFGFDLAGRPLMVRGVRPDTGMHDEGIWASGIDPHCDCGDPDPSVVADDGDWEPGFSEICDDGVFE